MEEGTLQGLVDTLTKDLQTVGLHCDFVRVVGHMSSDDADDADDADDEDGVDENFDEHFDENGEGLLTESEMIDRIKSGQGQFCLAVRARTKKKAWTRKVLKPIEYVEDQQFKNVGPTAREMAADSIREQLASGVDPSDVDLSLFTMGLHIDDEESDPEESHDDEDGSPDLTEGSV